MKRKERKGNKGKTFNLNALPVAVTLRKQNEVSFTHRVIALPIVLRFTDGELDELAEDAYTYILEQRTM